jgi:hypothetical protein
VNTRAERPCCDVCAWHGPAVHPRHEADLPPDIAAWITNVCRDCAAMLRRRERRTREAA